jgi:hypothetical protein
MRLSPHPAQAFQQPMSLDRVRDSLTPVYSAIFCWLLTFALSSFCQQSSRSLLLVAKQIISSSHLHITFKLAFCVPVQRVCCTSLAEVVALAGCAEHTEAAPLCFAGVICSSSSLLSNACS